MRMYFAASLFCQHERVWNRALARALEMELPGLRVTLPQDFSHGSDDAPDKRNRVLFRKCVKGIDAADVVLAILDGADPDSGTSWEMGYAYARGIPVIGVRTDFRQGEDSGVNLMLARACRSLVTLPAQEEDVGVVAREIATRLKKFRRQHGSK